MSTPLLVKQVRTRHGPMLVIPEDAFITRCLEVYGEFSPEEQDILSQMIRPGSVVVEVGANIGAHTIALARGCAPGRLYAFEPQQRVFQILCANLVLNDIENVVASPDACGAAPGMATIPAVHYGRRGNFGGVELLPEGASGWPVRVVTVDDLNLSACALIKVDVEGFELQVLEGARATIARHRPYLYVENDRPAHQRAMIALVHELGYRAYWHTPLLNQTNNFNGATENVFDRPIVSINMLCIPSERRTTTTNLSQIDPADPRAPPGLNPSQPPLP